MQTAEGGFLISPVIFAILGLGVFFIAQFLGLKMRVALSLAGLLLLVFFFYKLRTVESNILSIYTNPENKNIRFTSEDLYLVIVGLNLLSLCLWLFATLRITVSAIVESDKKIFLACSAILMATNYVVFKLFGQAVCFICFPIISIGYFAVVDRFFNRPHVK